MRSPAFWSGSTKVIRPPRTNCCRWSTTNCGVWRAANWPRRSPARRSKRRLWFMRPTRAWVGADQGQCWKSRGHFFGAAAEAMRRIMVDHARSKKAQKRGGGAKRVDIDPAEQALQKHDDK